MAKKKKPKPFPATKAVKLAARELLGSPPPERVIPDPKKRKSAREKHKATLSELLLEE